MQSSAMVALRTAIMITCLVAVPLAAVFGTALPKVVQSAFGRKTSPLNPPAAAPPAAGEEEPPAAVVQEEIHPSARPEAIAEMAMAENRIQLPMAHITGVRPIDDELLTPPSAASVETAPLWNPPPRTARATQSGDMTAHFAPSPRHRADPTGPLHKPRAGGLQKTGYSPPQREPMGSTDEVDVHDRLVAVEGPADNALAEGERRLRGLGATYYRLEAWGGENQFYRCSCSIALRAGSRATRHFEAIEAAPSQAIEAVIKQVDAWRARRGG